MKKLTSIILMITILVFSFQFTAFSEITGVSDVIVTISETITRENDLIHIRFDITSNVDSAEEVNYNYGIAMLGLEYYAYTATNTRITTLTTSFDNENVSIDASGLPSSWMSTAVLKNNSIRMEVGEGDNTNVTPLYKDRPGYFILTLKILNTNTFDKIILKPSNKASFNYASNKWAQDGEDFTTQKSSQINIQITPTIEVKGAQIRSIAPAGLRFVAEFTKDDFYDQFNITSDYSYDDNSGDIAFGTLIAITSKLGTEALTKQASCKTLDIPAKIIQAEDNDKIAFTGVVINFPQDGSYDSVDFTAVAYVKVGNIYYYSNSIIRNHNQVAAGIQAIINSAVSQ